MEISPEIKEWLTLIFGFGFGIGGFVAIILLPVMYFRLTRKYDAMFPEYDRIIPLPLMMGAVIRTSLYAYFIAFKNLRKHKRHRIAYEVTNGYDFRANAPLLDIILSYLISFSSLIFVVSGFTFYILTEIFGIDL
ncbi:MAG: hypothetical protein COB33_008315 [Thiotrichaceae bacterium]|nr:hypothetical protein [Thiotrichaceae bacterium]PCI10063.1 MAG: hypothetical protein COB71_13295 [Thiotrichales bacterium]